MTAHDGVRRHRLPRALAVVSVAVALTLGAAAPAFAVAETPEPAWAQVTALQGDFDLRAGDIDVLTSTAASPAHRLVHPVTDINLVQGGGAEPLVDTPLLRLTADGTSWTILPYTGASSASIRDDGVLVSVLGNLVYDGSARSSAVCPAYGSSASYAEATGIVAGLNAYVGPTQRVWEFDKKAQYLDLGDAGRSVQTPDAVLHIRLESVDATSDQAGSAWVLLTVDLRGSLPDYGPVDQRLATVKLATSEVSCGVAATAPGGGASGVGSPGEPSVVVEPVPAVTAAPAVAPPAVVPVTTKLQLAESGSEVPAGLILAGALLAVAGVGMLRLWRRA